MTKNPMLRAASMTGLNVAGTVCAPTPARYTPRQLYPSETDIAACRISILERMPHSDQEVLNAFVHDVFSDDDLVQAYLLPTGAAHSSGTRPVMPLDQCERAATRAGGYGRLLHRLEREVAAVAAFVQLCGYYWCARQQALGLSPGRVTESYRSSQARISAASRNFLELPLRQLCRVQPDLGQTLAQALGLGRDGEVDPQQVARIQAALGTAQLQMH